MSATMLIAGLASIVFSEWLARREWESALPPGLPDDSHGSDDWADDPDSDDPLIAKFARERAESGRRVQDVQRFRPLFMAVIRVAVIIEGLTMIALSVRYLFAH